MFDFLIRAWFENKEKKTKSAFLHLKENQFKERVNDIRSFCSTCWDSEELKSIGKYFNCSRLYSVSANCSFSHHVRQTIKEKYEAFVSKCNAPMELLIDVYNSFYHEGLHQGALTWIWPASWWRPLFISLPDGLH